jgi:pyrimidine operon attenuation protein/uracil phosphoribosyltransferase
MAAPGERIVLNADDVRRALTRMAHEIVEQNRGVDGLVLVGLATRGVPLAERIRDAISSFERGMVPCGRLDVTLYRDDLFDGRIRGLQETRLPGDITGARVVLVDDVLYTGRTIRAALDALMDYGRPNSVQLAVLIDRGHRELPIRANFVGKNVPTSRDETVSVRVAEIDHRDQVSILGENGGPGDSGGIGDGLSLRIRSFGESGIG